MNGPDLSSYFGAKVEGLAPPLAQIWFSLGVDHGAERFLERASRNRHGWLKNGLHAWLRHFWSDFDVNGALNMYPLYMLSTAAWRKLLIQAGATVPYATLLDVGAGNGDLTSQLRPLCRDLCATEASRMMRWRLNRRGYPARSTLPDSTFDGVVCLNVLDRTARPLTLLGELERRLRPGGVLVLSVPLPVEPFYYDGPNVLAPEEALPAGSSNFEAAANALFPVLSQHLPGCRPHVFTKAPYLSGGDNGRPYYVLESGVWVWRRLPSEGGAPGPTPSL